MVRTSFKEAHLGLVGKRSEEDTTVARFFDAHLSSLALVIESPSRNTGFNLAGSAGEITLQDALAEERYRNVVSRAADSSHALTFSYASVTLYFLFQLRLILTGALRGTVNPICRSN